MKVESTMKGAKKNIFLFVRIMVSHRLNAVAPDSGQTYSYPNARNMLRCLPVILVLSVSSIQATAQSGWTRDTSDFFVKVDYLSSGSDKYYNLDGNLLITNTFRQQGFYFYGEYGVTERFAVNGSLPLLKINSFSVTKNVVGVGDARIEFKYALLKGKFPLAVSITPEVPTGTRELLVQNRSNNSEIINLATGDGEFNIWTTLAISHSFYPTPAYVSVYTAFNKRTKSEGQKFQDQLQTGGEVGYKIKGKLWLIAKMYSLVGVGKVPAVTGFIKGNGTSFTGYSLSGTYDLGKHLGITAQYFNYTNIFFNPTNIYTGGQVWVGLSYQHKR